MTSHFSNQIWHEISLRFSKRHAGAEEFLTQILCRTGFDETSVSSVFEKQFICLKVYCRTRRESQRCLSRLTRLNLKHVRIEARALQVRDWRDKWKEDLRPFCLTRRFDVVPSWQTDSYVMNQRRPIYLDTTLSFGTGLHETTRFMAELIDGCSGKFRTFLDVGTGTGILSILAAGCGAELLWAVDIDAGSIDTARENLKRNGLAFDWCGVMDFRKFPIRRRFDFVAANVITDELLDMRKKIISAVNPGKYLAVSGVSRDNFPRFHAAFKGESLRCLKISKGKSWAAALYQKSVRG